MHLLGKGLGDNRLNNLLRSYPSSRSRLVNVISFPRLHAIWGPGTPCSTYPRRDDRARYLSHRAFLVSALFWCQHFSGARAFLVSALFWCQSVYGVSIFLVTEPFWFRIHPH